MTDGPSAPPQDSGPSPAPDSGPPPAPPAGPPKAPRPGPPRRTVAAPPPPKSDLKKWLVLGIIGTSVLLIAAIGIKLYLRFTTKPPVVRNVKSEWQAAWRHSKDANRELFEKIESKVWVKGEELTPADIARVKELLKEFEKTSEAYLDLMQLMRAQGSHDSQEADDMGASFILLKAWIWDANGLLDPAAKPPRYGGLYIPMYHTEKRMREAIKRVGEIRGTAQEIIARNKPEEISESIKEVRKLRETLASCRDEFLELDDQFVKGLGLPDLNERTLDELGELRKFTSESVMAFKEAGNVLAEFPRDEPKKEEAPKPPEPPKAEEPPKPDEPKPVPPKTEEPPKTEDPPKTDEPKPKPEEPK